ncbi:MAG: hypothetical protein IPI48_10795 [bacterium]|nr:hypothetical protein [bacterium]
MTSSAVRIAKARGATRTSTARARAAHRLGPQPGQYGGQARAGAGRHGHQRRQQRQEKQALCHHERQHAMAEQPCEPRIDAAVQPIQRHGVTGFGARIGGQSPAHGHDRTAHLGLVTQAEAATHRHHVALDTAGDIAVPEDHDHIAAHVLVRRNDQRLPDTHEVPVDHASRRLRRFGNGNEAAPVQAMTRSGSRGIGQFLEDRLRQRLEPLAHALVEILGDGDDDAVAGTVDQRDAVVLDLELELAQFGADALDHAGDFADVLFDDDPVLRG